MRITGTRDNRRLRVRSFRKSTYSSPSFWSLISNAGIFIVTLVRAASLLPTASTVCPSIFSAATISLRRSSLPSISRMCAILGSGLSRDADDGCVIVGPRLKVCLLDDCSYETFARGGFLDGLGHAFHVELVFFLVVLVALDDAV